MHIVVIVLCFDARAKRLRKSHDIHKSTPAKKAGLHLHVYRSSLIIPFGDELVGRV
jgi:hypothetical protein